MSLNSSICDRGVAPTTWRWCQPFRDMVSAHGADYLDDIARDLEVIKDRGRGLARDRTDAASKLMRVGDRAGRPKAHADGREGGAR
jgi:hypothetical protein